MFSDVWNKIKELAQKMLPKKSIENVLHITPTVSDRMANAIQLWSDMYEGHSPWLREPSYEDPTRIVSLGLPALIASEKARMVTLEMKSEISAPMITVDDTLQQEQSTTNVNEPNEQTNESEISTESEQPENKFDKDHNTSKANVQKNSVKTNLENNSGVATNTNSAFAQKSHEEPAGPTERAEFLNKEYSKLLKQIRRQLEYGIAKGGLVIKPYVVLFEQNNANTSTSNDESNNNTADNKNGSKSNIFAKNTENTDNKQQDNKQPTNEQTNNTNNSTANSNSTTNNSAPSTSSTRLTYDANLPKAEIEFDFIQADRFFPLSFDANGKVVEAAFIQTKVNKALERVFIRLEYHKLENRTVTVQNLAFESTDMNIANNNNLKTATNLGKQIPLTAVPEWATLQPITIIEGVDRLLFAYFRMPEANTIDPYSPLGVSGYSRVIQLIKDADMQYSRLLWEFEGGEMAIDVDRDALKFITEEGKTVLPRTQQRLFRKIDLNTEDTYNVFAPPLRDSSLINGLNTIYMRIEDACGLSRGTLSDINTTEAKTATELKILKQRSFAANSDIQKALQDALEDVIYVMDAYCTLYDVTPDGEYDVSFEWDDSIIIDSESELSKRITLMQNGLASKLETRMWYFGETENQARAALRQVDEETAQAVQQNAITAQLAYGNEPQNEDDEEEDEDIADEDTKKKNNKFTKSPSDKTSAKVSKGIQADNLENPNRSRAVDNIKNKDNA